MAGRTDDDAVLDTPKVHIVHMMVFTLLVAIVAAILAPQIRNAFMANVVLNAVIIGVLALGALYSFRMVWRLWPEVNWVNGFRETEPPLDFARPPVLLAPMATLLGERQGRTVLSPLSMRTLLDSLAARLDESRDISRYLVGLLIFLGLLGTFWGLLETVSSIGDAIKAMDVTSTSSSTVFEELKTGLEKPLAGMGLSFSSSLFGLAGSLILGFLDLKAAQAQNRFYNDLENWLSTFTDIEAGDGGQLTVPHYLRLDLQGLQAGIDRISQNLDRSIMAGITPPPGEQANAAESLDRLATAVGSLVEQMREEQKMVRQWAQSQQLQHNEIQRLMTKLSATPQAPPARTGSARLSYQDEG